MITELQATQSARQGYRANFRSMAAGGRWVLYRGAVNVVLAQDGTMDAPILVHNVQAMAEQTMVNALSVALRRNA